MRLYAETNFILEAVLEQGESAQVEVLSAMADKGELDLVLPAASLFEAYGTVHRRRAERTDLVQRLDKELMQIGRSLAMATQASQVRGTLVSASAMVTERFKHVRSRLLRAARWIAMDRLVLEESCLVEDRHDLLTPDAVMLASVLVDARQRGGRSVFVTKNTQDFDDPDITSALAAVGCEMSFKAPASPSSQLSHGWGWPAVRSVRRRSRGGSDFGCRMGPFQIATDTAACRENPSTSAHSGPFTNG